MHRPLWARVLVTLWGIWFTTALTEPAGLFACAMHSGMVVATSRELPDDNVALSDAATRDRSARDLLTAVSAHEMTGHDMTGHDMSAHDVAGHTPGTRDGRAPVPHQHDCCTCIGQCGATAVVAPMVRTVEFSLEWVPIPTQPTYVHWTPVVRLRAHVLPYANGPPSEALV